MWMVEPKIMCRKHLLGEHLETHMFVGTLKRKIQLKGYVDSNCLELKSLKKRHDDLADEMFRRGYMHRTPLQLPKYFCDGQSDYVMNSTVDKEASLKELIGRCEECRRRYKEYDKH